MKKIASVAARLVLDRVRIFIVTALGNREREGGKNARARAYTITSDDARAFIVTSDRTYTTLGPANVSYPRIEFIVVVLVYRTERRRIGKNCRSRCRYYCVAPAGYLRTTRARGDRQVVVIVRCAPFTWVGRIRVNGRTTPVYRCRSAPGPVLVNSLRSV